MNLNTGHAVGCAALRGGVPCTCWVAETSWSTTPLGQSIQRLREQSARPHIQRTVVVQAADVEAVLDALAERVVSRDRGGETA